MEMNGLIACHIKDITNLNWFDRCLKSIYEQTIPLSALYISWSAEKYIENQTKDILKIYEDRFSVIGTQTIFLFQQKRHQQFQHYKRILDSMKSHGIDENALLIFGDADDYWQPHRVQYMFTEASDNLVTVFNWKLVQDPDGKYMREVCVNPTDFEYWMSCVRFSVFATFFQGIRHRYLSSPWCDLAFDNYLLTYEISYNRSNDCENWLYFKNGNNSREAGASMGLKNIILNFLEVKLMMCFPNPLILIPKGWKGYCEDERLFPLFTLNNPLDMDTFCSLELNKISQQDVISLDACCNRECTEKMKYTCNKCKCFHYCSRECQKLDWEYHKRHCSESLANQYLTY